MVFAPGEPDVRLVNVRGRIYRKAVCRHTKGIEERRDQQQPQRFEVDEDDEEEASVAPWEDQGAAAAFAPSNELRTAAAVTRKVSMEASLFKHLIGKKGLLSFLQRQ